MCYRRSVIGDGIFNLRWCGFVLTRRFPLWEYWMVVDLFAPVTLTLTQWPSYTNLTHSSWRYTRGTNMNFLRQGFQKLSSVVHLVVTMVMQITKKNLWQHLTMEEMYDNHHHHHHHHHHHYHRSVLRWVTMSRFNSWCHILILACNQPATQGQLSLPSLRGR